MEEDARFLDFAELNASFLTSSENLSAPVASEASARLVVLAATAPNAAASLSPEPNAARATCSAALIASLEVASTERMAFDVTAEDVPLLGFDFLVLRVVLGNPGRTKIASFLFKIRTDTVCLVSIK